MEGQTEKKVSVKLLIDTKASKVLFAEVGKEFVDFLFHIMSLQLGAIINLLNVDSMVGCLGDLYKSIESLNADYLQPSLNKDSVLKPTAPVSVPLLSLENSPTPTNKTFYTCDYAHNRGYVFFLDDCVGGTGNRNCVYYTDCQGTPCPNCRCQMQTVLQYVGPTDSQNSPSSSIDTGSSGFVKGVVTYMVMDNLEVKPMSTISGITLMNKFGVKDVADLEEQEVQVGLNEGIAMLKASFETKTVLSIVFLAKKIEAMNI